MNEIVNKFLLAGDIFMPEMHLKQPGFNYSACGPFTINKQRIETFMQSGNTDFIHKIEKIKIKRSKSKDLVKRTQSDKALRDKAFKITSDPKYDRYQRGLASMVYNFFDKKSASLNNSSGSGITNEPNYQLENKLHKTIIRKFKKREVYSFFRDNIWGVELVDMRSLSKYNEGN